MGAVLLIWIILLVIILALGDAFFLICNRVRREAVVQPIVSTFFMGLAMSAMVACGLSLIGPLTSGYFAGFLPVSVLYWIVYRKRLKDLLFRGESKLKSLSVWAKVFMLFMGIVVLYHASSFSSSFDQFLYHQQHIKWLQEYGVVKGLANLHTRFGFNSSSLSMTALLAYHPGLKISFTALNGLAMFVFSLWLCYKMFVSEYTIKSLVYAATLLIFAHFFAMELSSTSTDILVNIIVAYLLLACMLGKESENRCFLLAILPIFCVTLKLSSSLIVVISLYAYYHLISQKHVKSIIFAIVPSMLILIFWLAQNVLLTGYLIFPFPDIDLFSFDWKVPANIVAIEKVNTYNWARGISGENSTFVDWMPRWWAALPMMDKTIYLLSSAAIIVFFVRVKKVLKQGKLFTIAYATAIAGTLFGLLTAPALRFSLGFVLPTVLFGMYIIFYNKAANRKVIGMIQYLSIAVFMIFHVQYIGLKTKEKIGLGKDYLKAQYIKPFPLSYAVENAVFDVVKVNGVDIFVPQQSSCYDHELPCTVGIFNNLELRGEYISQGFRIKQE